MLSAILRFVLMLSPIILNAIMKSFILISYYAEFTYTEGHCTEYHFTLYFYTEFDYDEWLWWVIMMSVTLRSILMLSVMILSVIMLSIMALFLHIIELEKRFTLGWRFHLAGDMAKPPGVIVIKYFFIHHRCTRQKQFSICPWQDFSAWSDISSTINDWRIWLFLTWLSNIRPLSIKV